MGDPNEPPILILFLCRNESPSPISVDGNVLWCEERYVSDFHVGLGQSESSYEESILGDTVARDPNESSCEERHQHGFRAECSRCGSRCEERKLDDGSKG